MVGGVGSRNLARNPGVGVKRRIARVGGAAIQMATAAMRKILLES